MINNYHWELYKKSDGKDYDTGKNKFVKLHERYCPDPELTRYLKDSLSDSIDYLTSEEYLSFEDEIMETEITVDNALEALWQTLIEENKFDEKKQPFTLSTILSF